MTTHTPGLSERMPKRRMGGKLRNNFPSGRPKKISKGPVDHTKKWVELWLAALSLCRAPIGRLYVCYISQLLGDSFSVSQQPPICEFPSHSSLVHIHTIKPSSVTNTLSLQPQPGAVWLCSLWVCSTNGAHKNAGIFRYLSYLQR